MKLFCSICRKEIRFGIEDGYPLVHTHPVTGSPCSGDNCLVISQQDIDAQGEMELLMESMAYRDELDRSELFAEWGDDLVFDSSDPAFDLEYPLLSSALNEFCLTA